MSNVADEIDAIIARAMAEYNQRHPEVDVPTTAGVPNIDLREPELEEDTEVPVEVWGATQTPDTPNIVAPNSSSLLVHEETSRFNSAVWYEEIQKREVILAGLGGIGSYVAFLLSRLNIETLYLFDPDTVEAVNLSGQLYGRSHIGVNKARAVDTVIRDFSNFYRASVYTTEFDSAYFSPIMICGFDNMSARRQFYLSWRDGVQRLKDLNQPVNTCLFIDGRLAAESFQVFCIQGDDTYNMNRYETDFLFSDEEAEETVCSYKQTTFMANMIGSVMVNLFVNFVANNYCELLIPRDLPFFTEYSADSMYFKVVA